MGTVLDEMRGIVIDLMLCGIIEGSQNTWLIQSGHAQKLQTGPMVDFPTSFTGVNIRFCSLF